MNELAMTLLALTNFADENAIGTIDFLISETNDIDKLFRDSFQAVVEHKNDYAMSILLSKVEVKIGDDQDRHCMLNLLNRALIENQWALSVADHIGAIGKFGGISEIIALHGAAVHSAPTWDERNDEYQSFFKKCVYEIVRIGKKNTEFYDYAFISLLQLTHLDFPVAATWAKKALNSLTKDQSPYFIDIDDLSTPFSGSEDDFL